MDAEYGSSYAILLLAVPITRPDGDSTCLSTCGTGTGPPFTIPHTRHAAWSGVTRISPWPMARFTTTPLLHFPLPKRRSYHSGVGTLPRTSPAMSIPVLWPMPLRSAQLMSVGTPSLTPSV